jgi:hypothetical protein
MSSKTKQQLREGAGVCIDPVESAEARHVLDHEGMCFPRIRLPVPGLFLNGEAAIDYVNDCLDDDEFDDDWCDDPTINTAMKEEA